MDNQIYAAMIEATRLTREGRLNEATQQIQRTLRFAHTPSGTATDVADEPEWIEQTFRLTAEPVAAPEVSEAEVRGSTQAEEEHATVTEQPGEAATTDRRAMPRRPSIRRPSVHRPGGLPLTGTPLPGLPGGRLRHGTAPQAAPAGGQWLARAHTSNSGIHAYKLYIPSKYRGQPLPLVVMLHGCTQDPDDFAAGTRMNFLAEERGFLVAYPAQASCANASKCWNWFQAEHQQWDKGEPSLIAGITREVMAGYHVDASRVYVAGLSAGGAMAAVMAVTYPDLYAAVGVHSGLPAGCAHDLPSAFAAMQHGGQPGRTGVGIAVPLILFHGDHDATVHPDNADHLLRQWTAVDPVATSGTGPAATLRQGQASGGRTYTCELHHNARGQVVVERWIIHGAGHSWSGGSPNGSYTDPTGPDASREMVRFFREHPRETTVPPPAE
jgi:poly(hydroxyalkanoate) depolymerase family esterase